MFVVTVTLHLQPGAVEIFMPLIRENAAASLQAEEHCLQFDIATDPDRPHEVFLYEVYSDAAAFEYHLKTEHFARFDAQSAACVADKQVTTYREVIQ